MQEFNLIKDSLAPLATSPEALALTDDAAIIPFNATHDYILTKDLITAGTHFFPEDPAAHIAKKLLRTNLSDLAAMGATPSYALLGLCLPSHCDKDWINAFCAALEEDCLGYRCALIGGDTVSGETLTLSLTAIGTAPKDKALKRSGAQIGDHIYLTGTIGKAYLGLLMRQGKLAPQDTYLQAYAYPTPAIAFAPSLIGKASAAIDISDGLLADLTHLCEASSVGAKIDLAAIPLAQHDDPLALLQGGDDYELLFTSPKIIPQAIKIGTITEEKRVLLLDQEGHIVPVTLSGFEHKWQ